MRLRAGEAAVVVSTAGVTVAAAAEVTLRHTSEAATQRDQRAVLIPGFGLAGRVPVYSKSWLFTFLRSDSSFSLSSSLRIVDKTRWITPVRYN